MHLRVTITCLLIDVRSQSINFHVFTEYTRTRLDVIAPYSQELLAIDECMQCINRHHIMAVAYDLQIAQRNLVMK